MEKYLTDLQNQIKNDHKKKSFWQIWLPLAVSIVVMLVLCVFVVLLTTRDTSGDFSLKWSSISIIFMSLPAMLFSLLFLALLIGVIYLLIKLYAILPHYAHQLRYILKKAGEFIHMACDRVSAPIILVNSNYAGFSTLFKKKNRST